MANLQHIDLFAGESRTLALEARGPDNLPANLSGKSISWMVGRGPRSVDCAAPMFMKAGTVVSAPAGTFTVPVQPSDTQYMHGDYEHLAETTDGAGNVAVVTVGRFRVRPNLGA